MRKLIYAINLTIDGTLDHTSDIPDEELLFFFADLIRNAGLLVYGRITYQMMVPYWPDIVKNPADESKADIEFATVFDSIPKAVFSKTLTSVEDKNSVLFRTNVEDEIQKMKKEPGKDIWLGGVALPSRLIALGLVDEYYFIVHPLIVGEGRKLLEGIKAENLKLKFVDSKAFTSGCVVLHYENR